MKNLSLRSFCESSRRALVIALLLGPALAGCGGPPYLDDDEGAPRPSRTSTDHLSLPYATGTKLRITLHTGTAEPSSAWRLVSDQPAVLAVTGHRAPDEKHVAADVAALAPGQTTLRVLDSQGNERHSAVVTVATADRVRVLAHGLLRTMEDASGRLVTEEVAAVAEVREARVLTGGTGVFALAYFRGNERVYGRGLIQFDPIAQVQIENKTTTGSPATEWLFLKPLASGSYTAVLRQQSGPFSSLPIIGVPETELASLSLVAEGLSDPKRDESVWVLARARDASQRDVHGVYASFSLAGVPQMGSGGSSDTSGDLYRYIYAPGASSDLVASAGSLRASLSIPAQKGSIYNTTYLGCSMGDVATGARSADRSVLIASLLAVALLLRRARRTAAWT